MRKVWMLTVVCCCSLAVSAFADEVLFKSGDRLTGKIKKVANGKMLFNSTVAGPVTFNMEDIKTFATEEPIEINLADGTSQMQQVAASDEGYVSLKSDTTPQPTSLALGDIVKINPDKPRWKGAISAGATLVRGNTKSATASVNAEASRRGKHDRISLAAGYYFANQRDNNTRQDSTTADNWFTKGQYDYFFSKKFYGYGTLRYEKDRIAHLDVRLTPGVGLGYQWIESDDLNLSTEGGATLVFERYSEPSENRNYSAGRLSYHLDKKINEYVTGFNNLEYIPSLERADSCLVNADIGLRAALTARLAIEVKTQLVYNSKPAEDRDKKDLRHTLGVSRAF